MNTFQLQCFLAVASTLNFAKAAERLQISQPTVTNQIKSLEEELNVKLFNRSTRVVEITPEGQTFLTDAKSMMLIAEQAKLRFAKPTDGTIRNFSIGCGSYIQLTHLTDVIHRLRSEVPGLHPLLHVVPREQLFHLLEADRVDVIFDIREGYELRGDLKFKEITQCDIVCVCRKDNPLAEKSCLTIGELAGQPLIFCDPMHLSPELIKLQLRLVQGRTPQNTHFATSSEASFVLAAAGVGISFLPDFYFRGGESAYLKAIRLENAPRFTFGMFYKSYPGDSLLKRFVQMTQEYFSEQGQ